MGYSFWRQSNAKLPLDSFMVCVVAMAVMLCAHAELRDQSHQGLLAAAPRMVRAMNVGRAPLLDGSLSDPLWRSAEPVTDFRQREPFEGEMPTEKTEVRIL